MLEKNNDIDLKKAINRRDEDSDIIKKAKEGDTESIDYIIDKYRIMVKSKAKTYFLIGADKDDIIQEGMIGLYKAIRDYNDEKTSSFRSFADLCITRQIITAIKTATRQKHIPLNSYVSLNKPVFEGESERTLYDTVISNVESDPEKLIIGKENYEYIEKKINEVLSPFEEEVLILYISGHSYSDIAKELKKDSKSVDNAIQRIKRKMEKHLENRED
ncbi:RNA polymerase sporulation sigma factor SigH [Peptostreptococcus faecalis]|uniref:RNA polymerase sporulation sigma factor SigH n=1 Tax=Peptostreptococcus faecalis TaxID=2045015 RepID=UPI000C79B835|nr:RNA polymerase sporulation sigma factor SigH [Peptostreptococcus faecalis]